MLGHLALVFPLAGLLASGQTVSLGGPVSGLLYDPPSRSIRPVIGYAGSAYLGNPALADVDNAFLSPDGDVALVLQRGEAVLIRGLLDGNLSRTIVSRLAGQLSTVSWASNSRSLVSYQASTKTLMRFEIANADAGPASATDLSSLPGEVVSVVSNGDASRTVIGIRSTTDGGLYAVTESTGVVRLTVAADPGPAAFSPSSDVLFTIEDGTKRVLRIADGAAEQLFFSGEVDPVADPVALRLSADGQHLFVAGLSGRVIRDYDLRTQALAAEVPLDIAPQSLAPLARIAGVFLLAGRTSMHEPAWFFDTRVRRSVFFAPAGE